jgi:hypothetical protein
LSGTTHLKDDYLAGRIRILSGGALDRFELWNCETGKAFGLLIEPWKESLPLRYREIYVKALTRRQFDYETAVDELGIDPLEVLTPVKLVVALATASRLGFIVIGRDDALIHGDPETAKLALYLP